MPLAPPHRRGDSAAGVRRSWRVARGVPPLRGHAVRPKGSDQGRRWAACRARGLAGRVHRALLPPPGRVRRLHVGTRRADERGRGRRRAWPWPWPWPHRASAIRAHDGGAFRAGGGGGRSGGQQQRRLLLSVVGLPAHRLAGAGLLRQAQQHGSRHGPRRRRRRRWHRPAGGANDDDDAGVGASDGAASGRAARGGAQGGQAPRRDVARRCGSARLPIVLEQHARPAQRAAPLCHHRHRASQPADADANTDAIADAGADPGRAARRRPRHPCIVRGGARSRRLLPDNGWLPRARDVGGRSGGRRWLGPRGAPAPQERRDCGDGGCGGPRPAWPAR